MKDSFKKSVVLTAAAAMMAGMTSCSPSVPVGNFGGARLGNFSTGTNTNVVRNGKKWLLMVHLAADNNLYQFGLEDVNEMEQGLGQNPAVAEQVDIIVLFDGTPKGDSKILRIKPDPGPLNTKIISEVIDDKGFVIPASKEIDSGDVTTAAKFVDFATKNFPAQKTWHAIWNHGSGVFRGGLNHRSANSLGPVGSFFDTIVGGGETGQKVRGNTSKVFASDDSGSEMHLKDVQTFMAPAKRNLGRNVDIVGFDACLMQHVETAYQYTGLANILVASEELEPGAGWDYNGFVGALAKNPDMNPPQLAKAMVDTFVKFYQATGDDATLSAVDINQVANTLVPALNEYAQALQSSLPAAKPAINAARQQMQVFYNRDAGDLGDFVKKYSAAVRDPRAGAAGQKLQAAMQASLVAEGHTGPGVQGATGIQVYFPSATMNYNRRYDDANFMRFAETKGWGNFLKAYTAK